MLYLKFVFREHIDAKPKSIRTLMKMDEKKMIKDPIILRETLAILLFVFLLFMTHGALDLPASFMALIGASLVLMLASPCKDPTSILRKIEWPVLLFFTSLFVIV